MVAVLMLFAVSGAGAVVNCDPERKEKEECFESNGYVVEVVKDAEGNFPQTVNGDSVFTYRITRVDSRKKLVSHADILIPVCTPPLGRPIDFKCEPVSCTGQEFFGGSGEPFTGFGLGLTTEDTWKWNWLWPLRWPIGFIAGTGTVSITMPGKVYASPNAMLVMVGLLKSDFLYGQILAPACALIPAPTFPPQVPLATRREESAGGIAVCLESSDQSGCPTEVFSCSDDQVSVCACDPNLKILWDKISFSDIAIGPENPLNEVWTKSDPRCPLTYLFLEGSCTTTICPGGTGTCSTITYPSIAGKVFKADGSTPNANVTMSGFPGDPVKTNANGGYKGCVPKNWSGTVTPKKTGWTFTPVTLTYSGVTTDRTQQNYTGTQNP
jgi:hypothetical protein